MKTRIVVSSLLILLSSCTPHVLKVQPLNIPILYNGKGMYQNVKDFPFEVHGKKEKVPKGFVYDGASIPWWAYWFILPDGLDREGALIHDWCYVNQGILKYTVVTKDESDLLLRDACIKDGVTEGKSNTVYKAVHWFGGPAWRSKDEIIILPVEYGRRSISSNHKILLCRICNRK